MLKETINIVLAPAPTHLERFVKDKRKKAKKMRVSLSLAFGTVQNLAYHDVEQGGVVLC